MRNRNHALRLARRVAPAVVGVLALGWSASAVAADDPPTDGATLIRSSAEPTFELRPWRGLENRFGRELTWARYMMAGDVPAVGSDDSRAAPWLDLASFRGDQALLRPQAGESAVSAIGSMVIAGLPVLGVWRGGRLKQRHVLRGYFRGRGVALAWRIEF